MSANIEPIANLSEVIGLLAECELPVADISPSGPARFFGIRAEGRLAAVIGLEPLGKIALLRSLAVAPARRHHGLGRELVAHAEQAAGALGIRTLYLLTTTATGFFEKLGYAPTPRDSAPAEIQATSQFAGLCPASSALLSKVIAAPDPSRTGSISRQGCQ